MDVTRSSQFGRAQRACRRPGSLALAGVLALAQAACLGEYVSMALGGDGRALVAYADTDAGTLKVAHCEDAACTAATISLIGDAGGASHTAIARGSDGLGLISYVEATISLNVAHCEDAACARARVSVLDTGHFASHTSVAIGRDGLGLISYRDHAAGELHVAHDFLPASPSFPFGAHVAVVEVDTETGSVELVRLVAVDDAGTLINPLIAAGQVHGGVATGVAQALYENYVYDADGNPLSNTFAGYGFPSAAELPSWEVVEMETPTPVNALGAKGIGESGTIGATPAVQNAVIDALAHLGVRDVPMPANGENVFRALQEARS